MNEHGSSGAILISLPNWLGDAVLATGLLAGIGRLQSPPIVDVCGNPTALAVTQGHPVVRRAIRYERHGEHGHPGSFLSITRSLRRAGYARHVVLPSTPSAAFFARLVAAPERVGFDGPARRWCFTRRARRGARGGAHLLEEYRSVVALLDLGVPAAEPEVHVSEEARRRARALISERPYAVLAPGATFGPTKRWPAARFAQVGAALAERHGLDVVLVGGPGDRLVTAAVNEAIGAPRAAARVVDCAGRTDVAALAAVLAGARVVVSNDSGPMHLARAVGTPTIGIFGSTEPDWTGPRGGRVVIAAERPPCAPCYSRRCGIDFVCLERISVEAVMAAADLELGVSRPSGGKPEEQS